MWNCCYLSCFAEEVFWIYKLRFVSTVQYILTKVSARFLLIFNRVQTCISLCKCCLLEMLFTFSQSVFTSGKLCRNVICAAPVISCLCHSYQCPDAQRNQSSERGLKAWTTSQMPRDQHMLTITHNATFSRPQSHTIIPLAFHVENYKGLMVNIQKYSKNRQFNCCDNTAEGMSLMLIIAILEISVRR